MLKDQLRGLELAPRMVLALAGSGLATTGRQPQESSFSPWALGVPSVSHGWELRFTGRGAWGTGYTPR